MGISRRWSSEPEWYYYAHIIIMDVLSIGYNVLPGKNKIRVKSEFSGR